MTRVFSRSAVVAVMLFATAAFAQGKKDDKSGAPAGGKTKVYDFSADTIEGDLVKPDGSMIDVRKFTDFSSLIRIRKDFIAEILKSAENL
jgi:hypothetical protein